MRWKVRRNGGEKEEKGTKQILSSGTNPPPVAALTHPLRRAEPCHLRILPPTRGHSSSQHFGRHIQATVSNITFACMSVRVYVCIYICVYVCAVGGWVWYVCWCGYLHVDLYDMHMHVNICVHVYLCVCIMHILCLFIYVCYMYVSYVFECVYVLYVIYMGYMYYMYVIYVY